MFLWLSIGILFYWDIVNPVVHLIVFTCHRKFVASREHKQAVPNSPDVSSSPSAPHIQKSNLTHSPCDRSSDTPGLQALSLEGTCAPSVMYVM